MAALLFLKERGSDGQSEATGHELDYQTHTHQPDPPPEDSHELIRPLTSVCVCSGGVQALTTGGAKNEQQLRQQYRGVTRAGQGNKDPPHANVLSNHVPLLSSRAARNRYTKILLIMPTNVCPLALSRFHKCAVIPNVLEFHEDRVFAFSFSFWPRFFFFFVGYLTPCLD